MGLGAACRRWVGAALVMLSAALVLAPAWGRTVLELDSPREPVPLLDWGDVWLDPTGQATPGELAQDRSLPWKPTDPDAIYPLTTGKALWFRFTVPPAPDAERWYLVVPYSSVNRVVLYTPDSAGAWQGLAAGDTLPVAEWPVPHRHPLLPIQVTAEEPRHYLLRVENGHSFSAPLSFASESWLSRNEQRTSLILGIYFGLAGLAAVLAALSAISLRDPAYATYSLSVALMGLTQAAMTGIAGLHLWPHSPRWNDVSSLVLPVLGVGAALWFFASVVSLPQRSLRMHRLLLVVACLSIVVAAGIAVVDPSNRFRLMVPYIAVGSTLAGTMVLWAAHRGDRFGGWLLLGALPVLVGAAFPLARTAGLIPVSFWTMHAMQIGIALELPIVLVILMLRSQQRRDYNRRIQGLDRIDPATGLINEQVFRERLVRLIAVSERLKLRAAVMLVTISNVEQMRQQFGSRAVEELPLRVAGRLMSVARDIDSVARLSEHTFGILMEGPLATDEVAAAGPRVVARCLMPFANKPLEWVAQVRVAQALVPMDGTDPDMLLGRLQVLLASVPNDSKRAVFSLSKVSTPVA
ncbi:MAG: diguanylate cyclase [Burkholderiales bacterium]|nr:diguanylate cyclase [Burkholderiales bacterium]